LEGKFINNFGESTAISADGNTVIVDGLDEGAPSIVYRFTNGSWDTGTALPAQTIDLFGITTAMSADGNTVIVNGINLVNPMTPIVYRFTNGSWDTGTALTAKTIVNFGASTAMSADGNTVIVNGKISGMTPIVYRFTNGSWDTGTALTAKTIDNFGQSTDMSADGNTVIVNGSAYDNALRTPIVYRFINGSWDTGTALTAKAIDNFGQSTAMSADGNKVIVNGSNVGTPVNPVVYRFINGSWDTGTALTAQTIVYFGHSTAMSADGNTIVVTGIGSMATPIVFYDLQTQTTSTVPPPPFTITGLASSTEYTFTITPSNANGNGSPTTYGPITLFPLPYAGPAAGYPYPPNVTTTTIDLTWVEQVPEYATSFNVYAYSVIDGLIGFVNVPISSFSYTYTGLQPDTEYYFTVAGVNASGVGPEGAGSSGTYTLPL
jgi:hypothetical protein